MIAINKLIYHQGGTTAVQYALVAGLLSAAILIGSLALRGSLIDLYEGVGERAGEALVNPDNS
jgi:Flp pilus assembly pilin Flp